MTWSASDWPTEDRDGFRFRGGGPALDLPATLGGRLKPEPQERLQTPQDLARWFRAAGLVAEAPPVTARDLSAAVRLREAIYAAAMARRGGEPAPSPAVAELNRQARAASAAPQLDADGRLRLEGGTAALLSTVAREAIALIGGSQADRIRQCEAEGCALLFLDTSRAGDRRWCSMATCGNKAKVAEFRRRRRGAKA
ncbi:MAG: ABATE domain-containing protein [Caulobacterales bacterium]|nr:ABATE domain-containing protein [Caulobacterales bacterium]